MAEIKSIFGEFENLYAADAENNLVLTCKEFIKESEKFVSDLIYEEDRYKNKSSIPQLNQKQ